MKKLILILVIVAVILGGAAYIFLKPTAPTAAILYINEGSVTVDVGGGWQPAQDEMSLRQTDKVKTGNGEATIVFLEGEVMRLTANTEVALDTISKRKISVNQVAGETWNKVSKISGITDYTVSTPNTVATVRGTEFYLSQETIDVFEGNVDYEIGGQTINVPAGKHSDSSLQLTDIGDDIRTRRQNYVQDYVLTLKRVRWREIQKHQSVLKAAEKRGYGDADIKQLIEDVDSGKENEDELYKKVPSYLKPKAERTYKLTKEIKQTQ